MPSGDGKFASESAKEYYRDPQQFDDHAARLRGLEGNYSDLNAQLAANTVQLESVNEGVSRLTDQIGELHSVITSSVPALALDVAALKSLEAARVAKRERRRSFVSRYASGALVALSAAGLTKFLPFVWVYLHR